MIHIRPFIAEADPADGLISRACMAKYILGLVAEDFSQSYCLVSWADEVPVMLWKAAHGEAIQGACGSVFNLSVEKRKLILDLAIVAGGWWVAAPGGDRETGAFLPLGEWRARMANG